ncbi:MAG: hypothetical protein JW915_12330 [Chitinispirillaceae bacterium]|nr:hypothetical protein [Chitinispirillaceae bacterium]
MAALNESVEPVCYYSEIAMTMPGKRMETVLKNRSQKLSLGLKYEEDGCNEL